MGKRAAVAKPCLCLCRRLPQILPESIRQIIRLLTQRKTTWLHRSRLGLFALFPGEHFFRLNEAFSKFNWFLLCVILKVKFLMYSKSWKILYYIWTWICTTFVRKLAATKQIKTVSSNAHHECTHQPRPLLNKIYSAQVTVALMSGQWMSWVMPRITPSHIS